MDFLVFAIYAIALLFSVFLGGALLGVFFFESRRGTALYERAKQRLRALVFGWELPPLNSGGLGVACLGLIRGLAKHGVDVTFVLPKRFPFSVADANIVTAELEDVDVRFVDSPLTPYASSGSYAKDADGEPLYGADIVGETRRYAQAAANIAKREPHDVIYAHDWLSFGAGSAAKRVSGKPLIAHVHATEFDRSGGGSVNQDVYDTERAGMQDADRVIAVSHRTKDTAVERYGVPAEKLHVVWNGIDEHTAPKADTDRPARLEALKRAGHRIVLFSGRLTLQKGPDHFLRAAAKVAKTDPDVLFLIVGSGDMERQLMRQAAGLGIADRVLFPGFLRDHDLHEAYTAADVFVMPSVSEPFGIAALEAMRVGTPVIVSKQSGVSEAVPHAIAVDFWDADALAESIRNTLADSALREDQVAKGREAANELSWDRAAGKVRELMDELVPQTAASA